MQKNPGDSELTPAPADGRTASSKKNQSSAAMIAGAIVFALVMLLMAAAVRQAPPAVVGHSDEQTEDHSPQVSDPHVVVERFMADCRPNAAGINEFEVSGYVKNTGGFVVETADLRAFFRAKSGGESFLDFLLIVDSRLDEIGGGPLGPMSGRKFAARIGDFPDELEPEVTRFEIVNVRERKIF
jgi:hypothetical protein